MKIYLELFFYLKNKTIQTKTKENNKNNKLVKKTSLAYAFRNLLKAKK